MTDPSPCLYSIGLKYPNDFFILWDTPVSSLSSTKEMSFSKLNELEKQCKEILNDYDLYKNTSRKTLLTLILKDKVMIVLYILVLLIIIATVTAYMLHI